MKEVAVNQNRMPVDATPATVSPMSLIQVAIDTGADIDKLERLMAMEERWNARQSEQAFIDSMARLQAELPEIKKLKKGHGYMYAPISDIVAQTREVIAAHGFSYRFEQSQTDKDISVTCVVTHVGGHKERTSLSSGADTSGSKNSVQAIASAVTYLQRYTLCGAFGIVTADSDSDARLAGQAQQERASVQLVMQIQSLIESTGSDEERIKNWIRKTRGWPADAEFEIAQLDKETASAVLSQLKNKEAKANDN